MEGSWRTQSLAGSCCPPASPHIQSGVWGPREGEDLKDHDRLLFQPSTFSVCVQGSSKASTGAAPALPFYLGNRHSNESTNTPTTPGEEKAGKKLSLTGEILGGGERNNSQRKEMDSCENIPKHSGTGGTVRRVMALEQEGKISTGLYQHPHSWLRTVCKCLMETVVPGVSTGAST